MRWICTLMLISMLSPWARSGFTAAPSGGSFDYYISPTGSDSNPGTLASPWAITAINTKQAIYAGKIVGLMDGTYSIQSLMASQSPTYTDDKPGLDINGGPDAAHSTTIKAVNPRQAIITAKVGATYGNVIAGNAMIGSRYSAGHNYIVIDGLVITGTNVGCINLGVPYNATKYPGWVIKNCEIYDINSIGSNAHGDPFSGANPSAIVLNSSDGALIQNNYIHDVYRNEGDSDHLSGILMWVCKDTIIEYNVIIATGICVYGKEFGAQNTTIRYNHLDARGHASIGIGIYDCIGLLSDGLSNKLTVHHNVIIGPQIAYLTETLSAGGYYTGGMDFYNNTCHVINSGASIGLYGHSETSLANVYNNIFYDPGVSEIATICLNVDADGVVDYNLYYGAPSFAHFADKTTTARTNETFAAFKTAMGGTVETHSVTASDPLFVGSGARSAYYVLQGGSPAINAGKSNGTAGGVTCDIGAWGNSPPARIGSDF